MAPAERADANPGPTAAADRPRLAQTVKVGEAVRSAPALLAVPEWRTPRTHREIAVQQQAVIPAQAEISIAPTPGTRSPLRSSAGADPACPDDGQWRRFPGAPARSVAGTTLLPHTPAAAGRVQKHQERREAEVIARAGQDEQERRPMIPTMLPAGIARKPEICRHRPGREIRRTESSAYMPRTTSGGTTKPLANGAAVSPGCCR